MSNKKFTLAEFEPLLWWLVIVVYVLCLPSAIIVFNVLIGSLSLAIARWVPVVVIAGLIAGYFFYLNRKGRGYYVKELLLPTAVIVLLVTILQPNPIKHIHIPEYALLAVMLYFAQQGSKPSLLDIFLCTVLLGVTDELHQGFHPDRYYGWKDMMLNASGALIACLGLRVFCQISFDQNIKRKASAYWVSALIILVLVYSLSNLFSVQASGQFAGSYPPWLLLINMVVATFGVISSVKLRSPLIMIASINHGLIALIGLAEFSFR